MDSFYAWAGDTLILNVLGNPHAKKETIGKVRGNELKISVTVPPEDGKATDQMVQLLAKTFGVSPKDIEVVYGRFSIHKQFRIPRPKKLIAGITPSQSV